MAIKLLAFALAICALATVAHADEEELYSDKYDYVDVDGILQNDRLRSQYYLCFMEMAPCRTPDALFMKETLPEALVTKCRKCTDRQKVIFDKIVTHYTEKEPDKWEAMIRRAIEKSLKKRS